MGEGGRRGLILFNLEYGVKLMSLFRLFDYSLQRKIIKLFL